MDIDTKIRRLLDLDTQWYSVKMKAKKYNGLCIHCIDMCKADVYVTDAMNMPVSPQYYLENSKLYAAKSDAMYAELEILSDEIDMLKKELNAILEPIQSVLANLKSNSTSQ
jgi:hypothetical protein